MNTYDWMASQPDEAPPLKENETRQDPGHRPTVPVEEGDTTHEHHGNPAHNEGGQVHAEHEHQENHVILDPQAQEDLSVSNESIIANIRKFFGKHNRGSDYLEVDGNKKANGTALRESLEKTYCNEQWLSKQTHRPGKIKVGDLAEFINLDKIEQSVAETGAINAQFQNAQIEAILTNAKLLKPILDEADPRSPDDATYEALKAAIGDIKPTTAIIKLPQRRTTNLVAGKGTDEVREALSVDESVAVAKSVLTALNESEKIWFDGADTIDSTFPAFIELYNRAHNKLSSKSYNTDAWFDLMTAIHRKLFTGSPDVMAAYRQFESACIAAITYVERSFTGSKSENVSNEGIVDSIRKVFDASKDGKIYDKVDNGFLYDIEKELKDKYANPGWVKRAGVVEGKLSVNGLNLLGKEGDKVIADFVVTTEARRKEKHQVLKPVLDGLEEIVKALDSGAGKDPAKMKELSNKLSSIRGYKLAKPENNNTKPREGQTDALSELEVNKLAKQMTDLFAKLSGDTSLLNRMESFVKGNGKNWYRNWKYVEPESRGKALKEMESAGVDGHKFLDTYEKLVETLINDVRMGGELNGIKAYLMARFQLLERSVK